MISKKLYLILKEIMDSHYNIICPNCWGENHYTRYKLNDILNDDYHCGCNKYCELEESCIRDNDSHYLCIECENGSNFDDEEEYIIIKLKDEDET